MTTIVCTREIMVGDTLLTSDTKASAIKVFKHKGHCIGIAGTYIHCIEFVRWWKDGGNPPRPKTKDVTALVLTPKGKILCFDSYHTFYEIRDPFTAIGSGAAAAMGALHAGATPQQAVRIASRVDAATGGKLTVRRIAKLR